jgi:hypothetical protein
VAEGEEKEVKSGEGMDEKNQNRWGCKIMDCSTRKREKLKGLRIEIKK